MMGQADVIKILEQFSTEWLSNKEIAKRLNASQGSITANTLALRKSPFIDYKKIGKEYLYKVK